MTDRRGEVASERGLQVWGRTASCYPPSCVLTRDSAGMATLDRPADRPTAGVKTAGITACASDRLTARPGHPSARARACPPERHSAQPMTNSTSRPTAPAARPCAPIGLCLFTATPSVRTRATTKSQP